MLSLDIPIKKPITVPNFVKFEKEFWWKKKEFQEYYEEDEWGKEE